MRLPGFNSETSLQKASRFIVKTRGQSDLRAGVVSAGSEICNCNCAGGSGSTGGSGTTTTGGGLGPPGICSCSSVLGIGCSTSSNSCNPGFVPQCNCGVFGNSCQCVPGGS